MKAVIPVAGFGTRLEKLTNGKPKALMPVKGMPLLDYIIGNINSVPEIDEIFLVTNDKFFPQFFEWKTTVKSKTPITLLNNGVSYNEHRKGAVRDVALALEKGIYDDLIVIYGDNFFNVSLRDIVKFFHTKKSDVITVYDVRSLEEIRKLGMVNLDENAKVIHFEEKPKHPKSALSITGIYLLTEESVQQLKAYAKDDAQKQEGISYFIEHVYKKQPVYAYVIDPDKGEWYDLGSESVYNKIK